MNAEFENNSKEILMGAERSLIAVAMNSPKACFEITTQLESSDFYFNEHANIFEIICNLTYSGQKITSTAIISILQEKNILEKIGGIKTITNISSYFITDEGYEEYVQTIFKNSMGRQLDRAVIEIKQLRDNQAPISDVFIVAQQKILGIRTEIKSEDAIPVKQTVEEVIKNIAFLQNNGGQINGIPSGFTDLDFLTNGWQKGDSIILAARPSMGKTAFALNLSVNAAIRGKGVAFFSLEMPKEQLVQRILASESTVDSSIIRNPKMLSEEKWKLITNAGDKIKKMNIVIDDTSGINIMQLQSKLRKMKRDYDIDICFIDYLQLIAPFNTRSENRQNEIATISRQLKQLARELNIPIICLSQLSRGVEKREDKVPLMSDLRDSGAIEQDADIIMFLYREEYYKNKEFSVEENSISEKTKVIISKHRNGPTGIIEVQFAKNCGKFIDQSKNN